MCVSIVLTYIKSADGWSLCCRLDLVSRLVVDHSRFSGSVGFPRCGQHFFNPIFGPFHGCRRLSNSASMMHCFGVVVVDNVLSSPTFYTNVSSNSPSGHVRSNAFFFGKGFESAYVSKWDEANRCSWSSGKLLCGSTILTSNSHVADARTIGH